MIIAKLINGNGDPSILLGLSKSNLEDLKNGEHIFKSAKELGIHHSILFIGGETEDTIVKEIKELVGQECTVEVRNEK